MNRRSSYINYDFPKLIRNSGFAFDDSKSKCKINWNDIRVIDINKLIDERDFNTVDKHIYEVLNCQLNNEFNVEILDTGFVKLFRLSQLSIEYLLECRRHLDLIAMTLKADIKESSEKMANLKIRLNDKETEIKKLQSRNRKRHSNKNEKNHSGLQNVLKNLISTNENFSAGEQNLSRFNSCMYCAKIFMNRQYLQSHISRRHSEYISEDNHFNSEADQNLTEKLNLEIKELKEKLNLAEKQNYASNSGSSKNIEPGEKMTDLELNKNEGEKTETIIQQVLQKNEVTIEMFEEWKRKQTDYYDELLNIKTQLLENINELKIKDDNRDRGKFENENINAIMNKTEVQLDAIKVNFNEKAIQNLKDVKLLIDNQDKKLDSKLNSLDTKTTQMIDNIQSNIIMRINEFQNAQQTYQNKILQLENTALEQKRATEEQTRQIIEITKETNRIILEISSQNANNKNVPQTSNPILTESRETFLPPYEEKSDNTVKNVKSQIKSPHVSKKYLHKSVSEEDSVVSENFDNPPIPRNTKHVLAPKSHKSKVKSIKKIKPPIVESNDESTSESDDNELPDLQANVKKSNSNSMLGVLERRPNLEKAIKGDLNTVFKKRLENLGVNADSKTICMENFRSSMKILKERQDLMGKQYKGYHKIKKDIIKEVDKKIDTTKKSPTPNPVPDKQNKPLRLIESIIKKVKTLNITKPRENFRSVEEKADLKPDNKIAERLSVVKRKLSAKSILAMIDTDANNTKADSQTSGATDSEDSDNGKTIVTTAISHLPTDKIDELLLSPIRKPNTSAINVREGFHTSSPIQSDAEQTNNLKILLERKSHSADNINKRNLNASPKGVLKTVSSINSLAKKKVNFDLDANEMKSLSSDNSSDNINKRIFIDSSNSAINLNISDDLSQSEKIENKPINQTTLVSDVPQQIQVSTKQSPKIAEIASAIESQLGSRLNITPPVGGIEAMFQAKSMNRNVQSIGDEIKTSDIINMDSDMELSDWSIDEILK